MTGWITRMFGRRSAQQAEQAPVITATSARQTSEGIFDTLIERADELMQVGELEQARSALEEALAIRHDSEWAHYKLGLLLLQIGRVEEAADSFIMATCFAPEMAKAYEALALAEQKLGKPLQALTTLERALGLEPSTAAYNLQGALRLQTGDVSGAVRSFEQCLAVEPDNARAHSNLGVVLFRELGEEDRGARHIERALELDPHNIDARCNVTMVLLRRGEQERVIALCDRILAADPGMDEARLNRALALLQLGRFEQAWDDYEARKRVRSNFAAREFPCREWRGEDLDGKTVLVYGEQGLGDEIMFASCFPDLIARSRHCVIECAPALEKLLRRSFPTATVFAGKQTRAQPDWWPRAPSIDCQVAAGTVPGHFRRRRDCFPTRKNYLLPHEGRAKYWADRLATLGSAVKVGISWRGGTRFTGGARRSTDLTDWIPVFGISDAHFVDLQYGDTIGERTRLEQDHGVVLTTWREAIDNLDELAALIAGLDVVVSVPTAVVHLAGAIGAELWILVPHSPEWRYQASGETMPWYPRARLIRQRSPGDWDEPIRIVASRLRELVAARIAESR